MRDLDPNSVVGEYQYSCMPQLAQCNEFCSQCVYSGLFPSAEWNESDVVEKYLKPTGFEHLAKVFAEQHINGAVLLALEVCAL